MMTGNPARKHHHCRDHNCHFANDEGARKKYHEENLKYHDIERKNPHYKEGVMENKKTHHEGKKHESRQSPSLPPPHEVGENPSGGRANKRG